MVAGVARFAASRRRKLVQPRKHRLLEMQAVVAAAARPAVSAHSRAVLPPSILAAALEDTMKRIVQVRFAEEYKWAAAGSLDSLTAVGSLEASGQEERLASALKDDVAVLVLCLVLFLGGPDMRSSKPVAAAVPLPSILWRLHLIERWGFQSPTRHDELDRDGHSLGETIGSDETWEESFGHVPAPTLLLSLAAG